MSNIDQTAKTKLAQLMSAVEPVIQQQVAGMSRAEINHILSNYRQYLKIDLVRELENASPSAPDASGFDDLFDFDTTQEK